MANWTEPADVAARWVGGGDVPATPEQLAVLIEDAEDTILHEFPDLPERIAAGDVPEARVRKVTARVVIRHLHNPSGVRSTQDGAGPFQRTTTWAGDTPGSMYLTDEDRRELGGTRSGRAFTIDTMPEHPDPRPPGWWYPC